MNKHTLKEIENLEKLIENAKNLDKYVEIAEKYFKDNPKLLYYAFTDGSLHINLLIDDRDDFTPLIAIFTAAGEKFDAPYFYDETRSLLCSSEHILLSGKFTGERCQIMQTGQKRCRFMTLNVKRWRYE